MGATRAQWDALIAEIEQARNQRLESDEQLGVYFRHLSDIPFERARRGVEHLIKHYKGYSFPSVATIREHCDKATGGGTPNAIAQTQDSRYAPWHRTDAAAYAMWRQKQIEFMILPVPLPGEPDEFDNEDERIEAREARYWAFVYDTDGYRRKCEQVWAQMWASGSNQTKPNERQPGSGGGRWGVDGVASGCYEAV